MHCFSVKDGVTAWVIALLLPIVFLCGCRRQDSPDGARTPPIPNAPALYGPPTGGVPSDRPRLRPHDTNAMAWRSAPFHVLETELSPATVVHSSSPYLGLFTGLTNHGLSAPSFIAWSTMSGPRSFKRGDELDVRVMEECWLLVWWAGAAGWTNWDSPWAVFLQHKPVAMRLDEAGLHLEFPQRAGDVVLLPLYGYDKLPPKGGDFLARHGLPDQKLQSWAWADGLRRDALTRLRYWACASRALPIYCEETFRVDAARDSVTIRSRITRHFIHDDWKTPATRLAPISPSLALAAKEGFPVRFSKEFFDHQLPTPGGPYVGVPDVDEFEATLDVLQYLHETEAPVPLPTNAPPVVALALARLREVVAAGLVEEQNSPQAVARARGLWSTAGEITAAIRCLAYLDVATRASVTVRLRRAVEAILSTSGTNETRSTPAVFSALWAYSHFTGDWELARAHWPQMPRRFAANEQCRWSGFGRDGIAEIGEEASACAAFARLAYRMGDTDSYLHGCHRFARELALLWVKQRGARFFREHQPWHSMEFMDEEVFPTRLQGPAGWQLDGPKYPALADSRPYERRWAGFHDWDLGRFSREWLRGDLLREMNWLQHRSAKERRWRHEPDGLPSFVSLRSLLLGEPSAALGAVATPDQFAGPPAGVIASCLAVLRANHPPRYQRLIPGGEPSPWLLGQERETAGPHPQLLSTVLPEAASPHGGSIIATWPQLAWTNWLTTSQSPHSFGHLRPVRAGGPASVKLVPLNWNTRVLVYGTP